MKLKDMKTYYKDRVPVYDKSMYYKDEPIRAREILLLKKSVSNLFKGRKVLEAACGTGYWTQILSKVAKQITATDAVEEMIQEAKKKEYFCPVKFEIQDAFKLNLKHKKYDAGFAGFWLSHILRKDLKIFMDRFHNHLKPGSIVFFADNVYQLDPFESNFVKEGENSFRIRDLNGGKYKVVKNYYSKEEIARIFSFYAKKSKTNIVIGKWAWWVWYETK